MSRRLSPFFHVMPPALLDEWLAIGFRERRHRTPPMRTLEAELMNAWRELSMNALTKEAIFDANQIIDVIEAQTGKRRDRHPLSQSLGQVGRTLAHAGIAGREYGMATESSYSYYLRAPEEVMRGWVGGADSTQIRRDASTLVAGRPVGRTPHKIIESTYNLLRSLDLQSPADRDQSDADTPWTLSLISQLIERCSRISPQQSVDTLRQRIRLDGDSVDVEVGRLFFGWESDPKGELGLIVGDDAQLILAILTMAMQSITADLEAGRQPHNRISFDLQQIAKRLTPVGGYYRPTYQGFQRAMARVINTRFRFTFSPGSHMANLLSPGQKNDQRPRLTFGLLERVVEGPDDEKATLIEHDADWEPTPRMRYFSFSLNEALWRGLCAGQGWIVHPELLYERRGMVHKVYHHLRMRTHGAPSYRVSGESLLRLLEPGQEYTNYRRDRQRYCKQLWDLIHERARQDAALSLLGDDLDDDQGAVAVRLFDLDVVATPDDTHADGIILEARQSKETIAMLKQQQARIERLRQRVNEVDRSALPVPDDA